MSRRAPKFAHLAGMGRCKRSKDGRHTPTVKQHPTYKVIHGYTGEPVDMPTRYRISDVVCERCGKTLPLSADEVRAAQNGSNDDSPERASTS